MDATNLTETIFKAADLVRGSMDAAAYSEVVSAVLLLKWASDQPGQLEVPAPARWDRVAEHAATSPVEALYEALTALLGSNREILAEQSWIPDFRTRLSRPEAQRLIELFDNVSLETDSLKFEDVVGQAYDRVLGAFADAAGFVGIA